MPRVRPFIETLYNDHKKYSTLILYSSSFQSDEKARAGESGYSILRQPLKWDPNLVPTFDVPASLADEDNSVFGANDENWWSQRGSSSRQGRSNVVNYGTSSTDLSTTSRMKQSVTAISSPEESQDLDLVQRTWDTLDYPRILKFWRESCTTRPAQKWIQQQIESHSNSTTTRNSNVKHMSRLPQFSKQQNASRVSLAYQPLLANDFEGTVNRYNAVKEMQLLMDWKSDVLIGAMYRNRRGNKQDLKSPPFGSVTFELEDILSIADRGSVLEGPELLDIVSMLDVLEDIKCWGDGLTKVASYEFVELPKFVDCISVNSTLQELLRNAFDKDGRLSGTTFPLIGQWRKEIQLLKTGILDDLNSLLSSPSLKAKLAMDGGGPLYSEVNGRIVIPVDVKHNKDSLGIVHDASRSGKTVYIEPTEIISSTNELRQAEAELRSEEARVWRMLTEQVMNNRIDLEISVAAAGQLDLIMGRVQMGIKLNGVVPNVGNEGIISLRDAKHPVLILRDVANIVGNDIDLGANGNQGLILTGPNSGGKTIILKLLGLFALMVRNGIPIPAANADREHSPRVDFFDPILADIGDIQSVGGDLSTFSGHMLVCREVLANAGENALVLMDELGSGTDPAQGVAIAQALLEALIEAGSRCAITTHYMELKQLAASDDRFSVGGMQFVNGRPTYKLLPGTVGESFALAVAERFQLPRKVIERANELLDQDTRQMGELLQQLENQRALVEEQVKELESKKQDMEMLEIEMRKQQQALEAKLLTARREEAKKFAKGLEEKEQILEEILEKLKKDPSRRVIAKSWDDIKYTKRDILNEAEMIPSVLQARAIRQAAKQEEYAELVPLAELRNKPELQVGDKVQICQKGSMFGKEATIMNLNRNKLEVKIGAIVMQVKMTEVALPNPNVKAPQGQQPVGKKRITKAVEKALANEVVVSNTEHINPPRASKSAVAIRTESNTVDVRGCNFEEAKAKITDKISMCIQANRMVLYVLHGFGERGILRTKVRDWLKSERSLVKRSSPAEASDGGDAFTKIELR